MNCLICTQSLGDIEIALNRKWYRFCRCQKGVERQAAEPKLVEEANAREEALRDGIRGCA